MSGNASPNRLRTRKRRLVIAYASSIVVNGVFWLFCGHLLRSLGAPTPTEPKDRTLLHAMQVGFYKPKPPAAPKPVVPKPESVMAGADGGTKSSEPSSGASAGDSAQAMQAVAAAGSGTGISQALRQSGAGTAAGTRLAAAATADGANDPSLASSLAPDQVHSAQRSGGYRRSTSIPRTQTAGSTRTEQRDAATNSETQIAQQAATDPDAETGDETGATDGGIAEKKPSVKPNATIVLKLVKTWTPRPDQKFELPPNLNIQLPDNIEIQPGPPLTPEQIEQIRKMLASQKMRHIGLDRKQLRKLLDAARKAREARKPDEKKDEKKKEAQVAKKPAPPHPPAKHALRVALVTPSKPRSPFTYRQWNPEMASEWMPDQDEPKSADVSPQSPTTAQTIALGAKNAISHGAGKSSYAIAQGNHPGTAPGTGGLSHAGQDGSSGSGQQDGGNAPSGQQHGGIAGAGRQGNGTRQAGGQSSGSTRGGSRENGSQQGIPGGGQQGGSVPGGGNQGARGQRGGAQQNGVAGATQQGGGQQNSSVAGGRQQNSRVSGGQQGNNGQQNAGVPGGGRQGGQQNGNVPGRGNQGNGHQQGGQQNGGVAGGSQSNGGQQNGDVPGGSQQNGGNGQQNGVPGGRQQGRGTQQGRGGQQNGVPGAGQQGGRQQGNGGQQGSDNQQGSGNQQGGQQNGVPGGGQGSGSGQQNGGVPGSGQGNGGGQPQGGAPRGGQGNGGVPGGGQGQGMAGNGNGQGQSPGLMGNSPGQGQGAGENAGVGVGGDGMLTGESADGMQSESDVGDANGEETVYVAAVGGPPDPPDHDPSANKGIPGALVLPPSPPVGTDNGTLPDPRPVKKSHVQRPVGNLAVANRPDGKAAPAQRAAKTPVGMRDKSVAKPQPPVLTVGSTSTHGTYVLTVMNRPHLALGTVSDTIDPPIPPAKGDRKSPLLKPKKTTSRGMSASHGVKPIPGNRQNAPLVRVAKNSQGVKEGTETPLPATLLPSKDSEVGDGSGLKGEYYLGRNFDTFLVTRADASIEYDWHYDGSPDDRIPPGTDWSIRWTGKIAAPTTEKYTFYASADDGVRVWINHRIIIDDWTLHAAQEYSNTVDMIAGKQYDIKVEYFESGGPPAGVELYWESSTMKKQFIPESAYFYPLPTDEDAMAKDVAPPP